MAPADGASQAAEDKMTFTPGQPENGQSLGASKVPIRDNFTSIVADLGVNHVAINLADQGKHKFLQMPEQGSAPTTAANEGGFYAKVGTLPAETDLFFRGESNGFEYQLTRVIAASTASFGTNTVALGSANGFGGWTFLPGNLLLQYGRFNPNTSTTVQFPIAFNAAPFSVQLTGSAANNSTFRAGVSTGTLTASQFVFEGSVNANWNPIYFIAIGV